GFEFWNGGVLVAQAPDVLFLADTDGDDRADVRIPMLHGLASADTHHMLHTFVFDPGGALYFQDGWYGRIGLETPWAAPERMAEAGMMRFDPRTWKAEVFTAIDLPNLHGHVFDRWGQDIFTDGTTGQTFFAALFTGRMNYPKQHRSPPMMWKPRTRPVG